MYISKLRRRQPEERSDEVYMVEGEMRMACQWACEKLNSEEVINFVENGLRVESPWMDSYPIFIIMILLNTAATVSKLKYNSHVQLLHLFITLII